MKNSVLGQTILFLLLLFGGGCVEGEVSIVDAESTAKEIVIPDLIIVGEGGPSGALFTLAAQTYQREHGGVIHQVTNGDEFVSVMKTFTDEYGAINHLEYFGHGNPVGLYVNQVPNVNGGLYANDPALDQEYLAASIYETEPTLFTENGWIQFNGCNVADGYPERTSLAQEFSNHFEVDVFAPMGPTEFSSLPDVIQPIENSNTLSSGYAGDVYMVPTYASEGFVVVHPQPLSVSGFVDVHEGQSYEEAVVELTRRGLDLDFESARFLPYQIITYAEAVAFCAVAVGDVGKCSMEGHDPTESIRNLRALQMLLDARGIELAVTDPWHQAYVSWASQRDLLTDDFIHKKTYTRGEMAELTWGLTNY